MAEIAERTGSFRGRANMIQGKKIVMVIASDKFRDEELFETREILESNGGIVTVASTTLEPITGMMGGTAKADLLLETVEIGDYDALVFVGGFGAQEYFDSPVAHTLATQATEQGKLIGAICIAPSILANAGLLRDRKATVYESEKDNLLQKGARYTGDPVTTDGDIVTGNGPQAATAFGKALVAGLSKQHS
jgi:protease I